MEPKHTDVCSGNFAAFSGLFMGRGKPNVMEEPEDPVCRDEWDLRHAKVVLAPRKGKLGKHHLETTIIACEHI